ncbi:MAG: class I SAM-dependent rRNA methyltransferase [Alphaproteobacteria bacterium]|nr:class I SAM-dependent rRNA methyltransferase [Alphaproteobacteria bacterium]
MTRPVIRLQPDRHRRILGGHPWAYSNEIAMTPAAKAVPPGSLVQLETAQGEAVGVALFNPHPLVSARLLSRAVDAEIDAAWIADRLTRALALRQRLGLGAFCRLIHAEADGLPGLVVDRYGSVVVAQLNTAGMDLLADAIVTAIQQVLAPEAIVLRNDSSARLTEGLSQSVRVAAGTLPDAVWIEENGVRFPVDPVDGQKTGWFYDQRDNRAAAAAMAGGGRVLDVFAYGGGFGLAALKAGAAALTVIDRSRPALERIATAAAANDLPTPTALEGDGLDTMDALVKAGERFDLVIADPPAFAKSRKDVPVGLKAYRRMSRLGALLTAPGGFLLLASCSHNVEPEQFATEVRTGLARAGRSGRILRSAGAASDHPVHPFLPESAYLKALLLQID